MRKCSRNPRNVRKSITAATTIKISRLQYKTNEHSPLKLSTGYEETEKQTKKLYPYTVFNKSLIFLELSDARLSKLLADELTLVTISSIWPRTLPGRKT